MKRFVLMLIVIGLFLATLAPVSAASRNVEQSALPIPVGFCVRFTMPIALDLLTETWLSVTWYAIPYVTYAILEDSDGQTMLDVTLFVPSGEARYYDTYDENGFFAGVFFEGLGGNAFGANGGYASIVSPNACSFRAYTDNAALAQTYMVPQKGYDVYQIFDGKGILSFTVSIEALESASAGAVLGSNDAGNIYFTYVGGNQCSVTYPYPDGKMNTSTFVCKK